MESATSRLRLPEPKSQGGVRMIRILMAAIALALSLPAGAQKFSVGYIATADSMPVVVAKEKGIFDRHKLDVTLVRIPLASNIPSAVMSDSVQVGMGTGPMLLQTADGGLGLVGFAGVSQISKNSSIVSLVVRTGVKVDNVADLRGKRIGVPGFNSMMHVVFQKWLLDRKVPAGQVPMVEAIFPQMADLLKAGTLDGVIVLEPFRGRIVSEKLGYKVSDFPIEVQDPILAAYWMAKESWVKANVPAVTAFRAAYQEAIDYAVKNQPEMRAMEQKMLGAPSPLTPSYKATLSAQDLEIYAKIGDELKMWRQKHDVNKLVWR
jgi:NitT/TauT family transport system substrate-binding protein